MSKFIIGLILLTLTTFQISPSKAETATSGNLLPNAGDGVNTGVQNSNSTIDGLDSASGFTLNGIQDFTSQYKELEAKGDGTVSASGSLVGISTTTQSGNSFTTTTTSLDGGVTLNAITEVQNCEWSGSSYQCGQATSGRDSYSTTIKILDENDNVLAITTMNRNNDAGYRQNTYTYTDTATYTDTGSRKWDWQWQGTDGNNTSSTANVGPNLLGASLTATLLDITYQPISQETEEQLEDTNELLELAQEDLETLLENLEEVNLEQLEELQFETPILQELEIEEVKFEELAVAFEETFKEILVEEGLMEEFQTALIEESITEEEFFEEATNIIEEELITMAPPKEETNEEMIEEKPTEEVIEEKPTNTKTEEESNATSNSPTKTETTTTEETGQSPEETKESGSQDENVSTESEMDTNKEAEGQEETANNNETLENEETGVSEEGATTTADAKSDVKVDSISIKVKKIIAKLEQTLKRVDETLQAVQYVTIKGMVMNAPDIGSYQKKQFYQSKKLNGVPNEDFFKQLNIQQEQVYTDITLAQYSDNDPLIVTERKMNEINTKRNELLLEIKQLRSN